jgi:hypothetical protein
MYSVIFIIEKNYEKGRSFHCVQARLYQSRLPRRRRCQQIIIGALAFGWIEINPRSEKTRDSNNLDTCLSGYPLNPISSARRRPGGVLPCHPRTQSNG